MRLSRSRRAQRVCGRVHERSVRLSSRGEVLEAKGQLRQAVQQFDQVLRLARLGHSECTRHELRIGRVGTRSL